MTRAKWQWPPVHPAADRLPMMSEAEIAELATDIKANGLQEPVVIWQDNTEAPSGAQKPWPEYLLDGRNRLAAFKLLGIKDPSQVPSSRRGLGIKVRYVTALVETSAMGANDSTWQRDTDPVTYVLSANVHRRHLTAAQKRDAIKAYIEADPAASDREVARNLGVSHPTVAKAREGDPNGKDFQSDHLPVERAKQTLRDNPTLSQRAAAKAANVGQATINKARKQLEAAGEIPPRDSKPKPKPTPRKEPNPNRDFAMKQLTKGLNKIVELHTESLNALTPGEVSQKVIDDYIARVNETAATLKTAAGRLETNHNRKAK